MTESKIEQLADKFLPNDEGQRADIRIVDGAFQCNLLPIRGS